MVNSCRSDFTFDMRINRYLSPLLWWKSAFEDTFPLDNHRVALWNGSILIVSGIDQLRKEDFGQSSTVKGLYQSVTASISFPRPTIHHKTPVVSKSKEKKTEEMVIAPSDAGNVRSYSMPGKDL